MNSKPMVISNSFRRSGVFEESWEDFSNGRNVKIPGYPGDLSADEVLLRARSKIGSRWNLFGWNSEHSINWAHGLKPRNPTVRNYATYAIFLMGDSRIVQQG